MIFVVTSNDNKWEEMRHLLRAYGLRVGRIKTALPEVQSQSLEEVVTFSAKAALNEIGQAEMLIEDSGLFIDRLNGFPGPFSSYVYKTLGCEGVLKLMEGERERTAKFVSVIAYVRKDGEVRTFHGECRGRISDRPRGTKGFGFDPIFVPEEGEGQTFGELDVAIKNEYSHRSRSIANFLRWYGTTSGS
ncbi:MAG: XTP/dITP diphosphatase [Aigarchaeota archaeon]|nr:XTP/dITP diphosphatase [Aigarchaeota archaeon]MDW8092636.1 XTP/dITP diphosphatase [Nitrososphaerota archaeon]